MSGRRGLISLRQALLWIGGSSLAGAVIGVAVGLFKEGGIEPPIVASSILFGNVIGLTAMVCSAVLFPRLRGLGAVWRIVLLGLALLSGAIAGTFTVFAVFPLFVFREPRQALAVVAINGILALIVGSVVVAYEGLRLRLQESLQEVEEVRLVEAQLREEAARAELAALQSRINPHFFFNTLNTISSLLEDDPGQAGEVVQTLADLFRYTFQATGGPVALKQEIEFVRNYLTIEQARFGERLRVIWRIDQESLEVQVPGLILQPLVENAVAHGIAPRSTGGMVTIESRLSNGQLVLTVADDGVGVLAASEARGAAGEGHGLANVRRRLAAYFRGRALLALERNPAGPGTVSKLVLPVEGPPRAARDAS